MSYFLEASRRPFYFQESICLQPGTRWNNVWENSQISLNVHDRYWNAISKSHILLIIIFSQNWKMISYKKVCIDGCNLLSQVVVYITNCLISQLTSARVRVCSACVRVYSARARVRELACVDIVWNIVVIVELCMGRGGLRSGRYFLDV